MASSQNRVSHTLPGVRTWECPCSLGSRDRSQYGSGKRANPSGIYHMISQSNDGAITVNKLVSCPLLSSPHTDHVRTGGRSCSLRLLEFFFIYSKCPGVPQQHPSSTTSVPQQCHVSTQKYHICAQQCSTVPQQCHICAPSVPSSAPLVHICAPSVPSSSLQRPSSAHLCLFSATSVPYSATSVLHQCHICALQCPISATTVPTSKSSSVPPYQRPLVP